jgi:hypothetical protein
MHDIHQDVGHDYMNIDNCYSEKVRSLSGDIIAGRWIIGMYDVLSCYSVYLKTRSGFHRD